MKTRQLVKVFRIKKNIFLELKIEMFRVFLSFLLKRLGKTLMNCTKSASYSIKTLVPI